MKQAGPRDLASSLMTQVAPRGDSVPAHRPHLPRGMLRERLAAARRGDAGSLPCSQKLPCTLLNSAGCPGVRDQGLGELPHGQDPLPTPTTPPKDGDRPGYELGQFQLRESELSRCKGETHSNLIKSFREARFYPFPVCNSSS